MADAGLVLEDVTVAQAGKNTVVRVTVDLDETQLGAVSLEHIAEVSHAVSAALDSVKALKDAYTLEVSSPGATRALTDRRHFVRARGRLIKVQLNSGVDFVARLNSVDGNVLVFDDEQQIPIEDVRKAKVEVELKRAEHVRDEDFVDIEVEDRTMTRGVEE